MQSTSPPPDGARESPLELALKDLGFAVKSLQLYPPTSPVVHTAIERSYGSMATLLDAGRLTLEVTPRSLRCGDLRLGPGNALVEQLSERLHGHGIARLHLDPRVGVDSLQRLAELVAADRAEYDERGGLDVVFSDERPSGVRAEFLQLDRLFEDSAVDEAEDIWEALLEGFSAEVGSENVDWALLANNVERLQEFVGWLAQNVDNIALRTGYESVDVYKFVIEQIGSIAEGLGSDHVNFLVLAVRRVFDQLDPETLVELLTDPFEVEIADNEPVDTTAMTLSDFLGGGEPGDAPAPGGDAERRTIDITQVIACGLEPGQAEQLILHTMRTRQASSTRLYGLFSRLMDGRDDRAGAARRVRGLLEQEIHESEGDSSLLDEWPRLADVLDGEAPERFVSPQYDAALRALLADDSLRGVWDVDRIRPRLAEMKPAFIMQRRALVLADVLEIEEDEERYRSIARELERALHELVVHDKYDLALQLLLAIQTTVDDPAKSQSQQHTASAIIDGFYKPEVLRQLVRNALGRPGPEGRAIVEIIKHRADESIPVLLDTLAEENTRRIRQRIMQILTALGNDVLDAVADRLDDERWYFLRNLILVLAESGEPRHVERIAPLLRHDNKRVRRQALEAMIRLGGGQVANTLIRAVDDPDEDVRLLAIHGLGFHRSTSGVAKLRGLLRQGNLRGQNTATVRTAAIALGRLKDGDSRSTLASVAKKPLFFSASRAPACEAARWALIALTEKKPSAPPEPGAFSQVRPGQTARRERG